MDGAISAGVADECNRVSGQELSPEQDKRHAGLVHEGKLRELAAWEKFDVYSHRAARTVSNEIVQTRWVLTWKMVDDKKKAKARLATKGFQDPDLREGLVSLRSSHLRVISAGATRKRKIWSLGFKNAFRQADGFARDVFIYAPDKWEPSLQGREWKLKALAYGLDEAPAAFRRTLRRRKLNPEASVQSVGLRCQAPTFDSCLSFVFRKGGSAVGAFATQIDDILGRGESDILAKMRIYSGQRFGGLKLQESSFVHVGMGLAQDNNSSGNTQARRIHEAPATTPNYSEIMGCSSAIASVPSNCVSASLVNYAGSRLYRILMYVHAWLVLHFELICRKAATCIASTIWPSP